MSALAEAYPYEFGNMAFKVLLMDREEEGVNFSFNEWMIKFRQAVDLIFLLRFAQRNNMVVTGEIRDKARRLAVLMEEMYDHGTVLGIGFAAIHSRLGFRTIEEVGWEEEEITTDEETVEI